MDKTTAQPSVIDSEVYLTKRTVKDSEIEQFHVFHNAANSLTKCNVLSHYAFKVTYPYCANGATCM